MILDIKLFVKNPKYYLYWRGLGLVNKEFKYGHLEPLLEEKNNIDSTSDSLRNKTTRIFK
jgi:hypothetical protein